MKKIIFSLIIAALGLALSNCGSETDSLIDKQAKITKLRNSLLTKDKNNLTVANANVEKALAMRAELSKKIKDACESEDIKKLNTLYDCHVVELERLTVSKNDLKEDMLDTTCGKKDLKASCQSAVDEIKGKMTL